MHGYEKQIILKEHNYESISKKVNNIGLGKYFDKSYDDLSGSGYVINTLETALWCFKNTDSFRDAILMTVNVGDDADTTAAVCGQIAGAYYGYESIPQDWRNARYMDKEISVMAEELMANR